MTGLIDLVINNRYIPAKDIYGNDNPVLKTDTSRNVKPEKPKGHLVNTPFYKVPFEYFEDLAQDTCSIAKGWSGKANDYELGKQNDIGMKLGGLAIASYLSTKRISKLPKIMEFVGLGSFFASLSLWPKLAIALPLKLRTGVDIQQKYVDSYGRKKNFFQDPQYLAWDLYSKEQINKMGDKMGVPLDVPNRDEVIKEKARKLAVQGNTLWLATAGFATPIMTGMICKGLEPVVNNLKQKYYLKQTEKVLNGQVKLPSYIKEERAFESFLAENMGKRISADSNLISKLNWAETGFADLPKKIKADLVQILHNVPNEIDKSYIDILFERMGVYLKNAQITKDDISSAFREKGIFGSQEELFERYRAYCPNSRGKDLESITREVLGEIIDGKKLPEHISKNARAVLCDNSNIENNVVAVYNRRILDEQTANKLREFFHRLSSFFRKELVLRKWENSHYTQNADSVCKEAWERGSRAVLSVLNISGKELEEMNLEGSNAEKIVARKISEIAKNPKRYKKAIIKIAQAIAEYETVFNESTRTRYREFVESISREAKLGLESSGFGHTARYIGGADLEDAAGNIILRKSKAVNYKEAIHGSLIQLKHSIYDERVFAIKSNLYRFIQALDLERRFQTTGAEKSYFEHQFDTIVTGDIPKHQRPNYKAVEQIARRIIMSATDGDHVQKLGGKKPNAYRAVMRILYGALPEKTADNLIYSLLSSESNEVAKALDKGLEEGYHAALNAGADKVRLDRIRTGLASETIEALNEASDIINSRYNLSANRQINLVNNIKRYFQTFIENIVNAKSSAGAVFTLEGHNTAGAVRNLVGSESPTLRASIIGVRPFELAKSAAVKYYKDQKWFKKFGIAGVVILAGTVIATTFFGHIPKEEMYIKKETKKKAA